MSPFLRVHDMGVSSTALPTVLIDTICDRLHPRPSRLTSLSQSPTGVVCCPGTDEDRARGALYPPVAAVREISMHVAAAVASKAYSGGVATELPRPHDLLGKAHDTMYWPVYRKFR